MMTTDFSDPYNFQNSPPALAIIGGSAFYKLPGLENVKTYKAEKFAFLGWGVPSGPITEGYLHGQRVLFIPRHGPGHIYTPTEVPYRANIAVLKYMGAQWLLDFSAVGILDKDYEIGDLAVVTDLMDKTKRRVDSFYGNGVVGHVSPVPVCCPHLHDIVDEAAFILGKDPNELWGESVLRTEASLVCVEGPWFSFVAESKDYYARGMHLIGMTPATGCKLAKEAGMCYMSVSLETDLDCLHGTPDPDKAWEVVRVMNANVAKALWIVDKVAYALQEQFGNMIGCDCARRAKGCVVTALEYRNQEIAQRLEKVLGKDIFPENM